MSSKKQIFFFSFAIILILSTYILQSEFQQPSASSSDQLSYRKNQFLRTCEGALSFENYSCQKLLDEHCSFMEK